MIFEILFFVMFLLTVFVNVLIVKNHLKHSNHNNKEDDIEAPITNNWTYYL